jgi:adenylate kinase family enzyme
MAKGLATELALPHIELDALNWEAGWRDLSQTNPDEFVRRVTAAIAADAWVLDGNYGIVRDLVWCRATHLIWLDYDRPIIMYRVIRRSLVRAVLLRTEMWAGCQDQKIFMTQISVIRAVLAEGITYKPIHRCLARVRPNSMQRP